MSHDPNDPVILRAALSDALDRVTEAKARSTQLEEALREIAKFPASSVDVRRAPAIARAALPKGNSTPQSDPT